MSKYSELFTTATPQSSPVPANISTAKQEVNSAGGFVFSLHPMKRLERFLILGSDSPTYYANAHKLTKENAACVNECWQSDPVATAAMISSVSRNGLAPKNSPAIFALALGMVHSDVKARQWAGAIVNDVCRTSTHLFEFVETCVSLKKGFGRVMKRAVANWYYGKTDEQLAYQLVKYRQRNGFTHERMIRLSHPKHGAKGELITPARSAMYDWLRKRYDKIDIASLPKIIQSHEVVMGLQDTEASTQGIANLLSIDNLPWEALPTWANTKAEVWRAMLPKMPLTAMLRNLGNMTRLGIFNDGGISINAVERLRVDSELRKARIHPFNLLVALKTYNSGRGFKGSNTWTPFRPISDILEEAFYASFRHIVPSNKRTLLALDVSGSMTSPMNGSPLTVREASSAMAMATMRTEENVAIVGFTSLHGHNSNAHVTPLNIGRHDSLETICAYTDWLPFSGTDCSLPMLFALEHNLEVDAFIIYTDNETWAGRIQPVEALRRYRAKMNIPDAKLIVVGMTSTGFTIADPNDPGMLDIVGFDASAPAVMANFIRGTPLIQHAPSNQDEETSVSDADAQTLDE